MHFSLSTVDAYAGWVLVWHTVVDKDWLECPK